MTDLQRRHIRKRKVNALVGAIFVAGWFGYFGWALGTEPPTKIYQWAIVAMGVVLMLLLFAVPTVANAWSWGVTQAVWEPESESIRYELKRTNDDLAKQRAKLEAKLR